MLFPLIEQHPRAADALTSLGRPDLGRRGRLTSLVFVIGSRRNGRRDRAPGALGFEGLGPGLDRRLPDWLFRPRPARLPDLQRRSADRRPRRRPRRPDPVHRRGRQPGPEGLPQQRVDGVRLDLRARRLPRPRLHGRLPPPRRANRSSTSTAKRGPTGPASRRSPTSRPTATTSRPTPSPTPNRRPRRSRSSSATTPTTSRTRRPIRACAPTRSRAPSRRTS